MDLSDVISPKDWYQLAVDQLMIAGSGLLALQATGGVAAERGGVSRPQVLGWQSHCEALNLRGAHLMHTVLGGRLLAEVGSLPHMGVVISPLPSVSDRGENPMRLAKLAFLGVVAMSSVVHSAEGVVVAVTEGIRPAKSVTQDKTPRSWQRVADPDSPTGWRLETAVDTTAPDLELPLPTKGIHEIRIGVFMPDTRTSGVYVRLDNEPYFTFLRGKLDGRYPAHHEPYFTTADCTGRSLVLRQPAEYRSYVTHVRLVPRSALPKLPPATKAVLGMDCTFHRYYFFAMREAGTAAAGVKMHERAGFTEEVFCGGRSVLTYETKVGTAHKTEEARPRTHWLHDHSVNGKPLQSALVAAEQFGLSLSTRLSMNCHYHGSYSNSLTSAFVLVNPQMHDQRRDGGVDNHRMCYGYPEVRAERLAIFREMVELGSRSLFIDCRRYMPMTQWGTPYIEGFKEAHGTDPRKLKETDPLWPVWLHWRAEFFTKVLRELRQMLDQMGHKDVPVTLRINAQTIAENLAHGADLPQIVKEGLVNRIVLGEKDSRPLLPEYRALLAGTPIRLLGCLNVHGAALPGPEHHTKGNWPAAMYRVPDIDRLCQIVADYYKAGLHGVAFYETDEAAAMPQMREFFIACRSPEALAGYMRERGRTRQLRIKESFPGFTFERKVRPRITASVGPIDGRDSYTIDKALDGDFTTKYIADRGCCVPGGKGCVITMEFPTPIRTRGIAFLTRRHSDTADWAPKTMNVEAHRNGKWEPVSGMPATKLRGPHVIVRFDEVQTDGLRLTMHDVTGGSHNPEIFELTWD